MCVRVRIPQSCVGGGCSCAITMTRYHGSPHVHTGVAYSLNTPQLGKNSNIVLNEMCPQTCAHPDMSSWGASVFRESSTQSELTFKACSTRELLLIQSLYSDMVLIKSLHSDLMLIKSLYSDMVLTRNSAQSELYSTIFNLQCAQSGDCSWSGNTCPALTSTDLMRPPAALVIGDVTEINTSTTATTTSQGAAAVRSTVPVCVYIVHRPAQ